MTTRRTVLAGLGAGAAVGPLAGAARAATGGAPDFLWGASTSAYQIEGAVAADGRQPSIWDVFSHTPGKIRNGDTGDVACDHYHRYREDVALMAGLGLGAYRFSVAWPRVLPEGTGTVNPRGLDFYDRLVDALLERKVRPFACLYHWDLPQALQRRGGWLNRDIAGWFADYAQIVAHRLGDRVGHWAMLNEPSVHALFGHGIGGHAPDIRGQASFYAAIHHQNLAQGRAIAALRAMGGTRWALGTVLSCQPVRPCRPTTPDIAAAQRFDAMWNRDCLDPLFHGKYPELLVPDFAPLVLPGDLEAIRQKVDFLGLNYYSRMYQQAEPGTLFGTGFGPTPPGLKYTAMGWPIEPDGLTEQLIDFRDHYGNPPVYVTENGAAFADTVRKNGRIEDADRIAFLAAHLDACKRGRDQGANLKGYFVWSLLDNFEWAEGYTPRFGIVEVDRKTLARRPKASYAWLAARVKAGTL